MEAQQTLVLERKNHCTYSSSLLHALSAAAVFLLLSSTLHTQASTPLAVSMRSHAICVSDSLSLGPFTYDAKQQRADDDECCVMSLHSVCM